MNSLLRKDHKKGSAREENLERSRWNHVGWRTRAKMRRGRRREMMEHKVELKLWSELDSEVVFVAGRRSAGDHMWKQSPAERFLITSPTDGDIFPELTVT